jgi:DNA-binding TFAR19-related protein (PDSD5 family)
LEEFRKKQLEDEAQADTESKIDSAVRGLLSEGARARLNNVRLVNNELYLKAAQVILYLANARQLQGRLEEPELKLLLDKLRNKREIKITRK